MVMDTLAAFFERNITAVYFFYGLAFFSLGLAVWLESGRTSEFRIVRAMAPLAGFGFLHGFHEWLEMYERINPAGTANLYVDVLRLLLLAVSFLLLIVFGILLLQTGDYQARQQRRVIFGWVGGLIFVWLASVLLTFRIYDLCIDECVTVVDVLTRYVLAIPGALLASWALLLERRSFAARGMSRYGRDLVLAAVALFIYGVVGQAFPRPSILFPSNVINAELFFQVFHFPVQILRAVMAGLLTLFLIRAFRAFEVERQRHLAQAQKAQLAAQREALAIEHKASAEKEALNQELRLAVQDLSVLFDLTRKLATTLDQETLLGQAVEEIVVRVPNVIAGAVFLPRGSGHLPTWAAASGFDGIAEEAFRRDRAEMTAEKVLSTGRPAYCNRVDILTLLETEASGIDSGTLLPGDKVCLIGLPLVNREVTVGCLAMVLEPDVAPFTRRDFSLMRTTADQLSLAMNNAALYQEVQAREVLRGELLHRVVAAQEGERQRIARELHDGIGQMLTGLGLRLAAIGEHVKTDPERAQMQLTALRQLNAQALEELRDLVSDLRPSVLDDLGLLPALQGQVAAFTERTGVPVSFSVSGRRERLKADIETVAFRVAQEALTNVAKHAQAQRVRMRLDFGEDALTMLITDDGRGFDPEQVLHGSHNDRRAWGLLGMQERVALVDGRLNVHSVPGAGTTVDVVIPLKSSEGRDERTRQDQAVVG